MNLSTEHLTKMHIQYRLGAHIKYGDATGSASHTNSSRGRVHAALILFGAREI